MRLRTLFILISALLAVSVAAVASANQPTPHVEYRFPVVAEDAVVPHTSSRVETDTLFTNERLTVWAGSDGLERRYTYYEERWVDGRLEWRRAVHPKDRPRSTTITTATPEIVLVGTRPGFAFNVNAELESPQHLGSIGASGTVRVEVRGTIRFGGPGTETGAGGNSRYRYYSLPVRPDIPPGALLFRVGAGPWLGIRDLAVDGGGFIIAGRPGDPISCVVNDAEDQYGDNRGSFQVIVWSDAARP